MAGALAGIRVLDLSDSIAGQFCTRMLADYGAEVLLVEPPGGGAMRRARPVAQDGTSFAFRHLNTGKGSVVLEGSPTRHQVIFSPRVSKVSTTRTVPSTATPSSSLVIKKAIEPW